MQLWQDGLVAVLATIGLVELLWGLAQAILMIKKGAPKQALAVIAASGDGGCVQEQVRALTGLGRDQGLIGRILVVDCGLNEEGQKLCAILERGNRWVLLCQPEEIPNYLTDTT